MYFKFIFYGLFEDFYSFFANFAASNSTYENKIYYR